MSRSTPPGICAAWTCEAVALGPLGVCVEHEPALLKRFFEKIQPGSHDKECWIWTGHFKREYGTFSIGYRAHQAHRVAWMIAGRDLTPGLVLDHLCRVTACVNPRHLREVTNQENTLAGVGPSAINATKTHCVHGHEFSPENTYWRPDGGRTCRMCKRSVDRARRRSGRAADERYSAEVSA